jgi:DNA-binding NtrC family response regulator
VLAGSRIALEDLSLEIGEGAPLLLAGADDLRLRPRVEHLERELIARALRESKGNQSQAARLLGLSRYGLVKKIKRYETDQG